MLFKEFGGVDALPICLDTKDVDEIVAIVQGDRARLRRHQPRGHRRAALLRDRAAAAGGARHPGLPRRPARHRRRGAGGAHQRPASWSASGAEDVRVVMVGAGAAGIAVADMLPAARRAGPRSAATARAPSTPAARASTPSSRAFAERTNPRRLRRHDRRGAGRADVAIGLSGPGAIPADAVRDDGDRAIVFALANPTPEVQPEDVPRRRRRRSPPAAPTTRTRSTTCSPSPASSAAPSTSARGRSTRR